MLIKAIMLLSIWLPFVQNHGATTYVDGAVADENGTPIQSGVVRLAPVDGSLKFFLCFIEDTTQCPGARIQEDGSISIPILGDANPYGYVVAVGRGDVRDPWQVISDENGRIVIWYFINGTPNHLGVIRIWRDEMFTPLLESQDLTIFGGLDD